MAELSAAAIATTAASSVADATSAATTRKAQKMVVAQFEGEYDEQSVKEMVLGPHRGPS